MKIGDIILAPVIQTDRQIEKRPLLLLRAYPPFSDFIACAVSTQLQHRVADLDEVIDHRDPDFQNTGLKAASLTRVAFLTSVPAQPRLGRIGWLPAARVARIFSKLIEFFQSR